MYTAALLRRLEGGNRVALPIDPCQRDRHTDLYVLVGAIDHGPRHSESLLLLELHDQEGVPLHVVDALDTPQRTGMQDHEGVDDTTSAHLCRRHVIRPAIGTRRPRGLEELPARPAMVDEELVLQKSLEHGEVITIDEVARKPFEHCSDAGL